MPSRSKMNKSITTLTKTVEQLTKDLDELKKHFVMMVKALNHGVQVATQRDAPTREEVIALMEEKGLPYSEAEEELVRRRAASE